MDITNAAKRLAGQLIDENGGTFDALARYIQQTSDVAKDERERLNALPPEWMENLHVRATVSLTKSALQSLILPDEPDPLEVAILNALGDTLDELHITQLKLAAKNLTEAVRKIVEATDD